MKRRRVDKPANLSTDWKTAFVLVYPYILRDLDKYTVKSLIQTCRQLRYFPFLQREFARLWGPLFQCEYPLVGFATKAERAALSGDFHRLIVHIAKYKPYTRGDAHHEDADGYIKWIGNVAYGPVFVQVYGNSLRRFHCFRAKTFSEMCLWVYNTMAIEDKKSSDAWVVTPDWPAKGSRKGVEPHIVYAATDWFDYSRQYMLARLEMIGKSAPMECGRSSFDVFMKYRHFKYKFLKETYTAFMRLKFFLDEWFYPLPWKSNIEGLEMQFTTP